MKPRLFVILLLLAGRLNAGDPLRLVIPEYAPYTSMAGGQPHGVGVDKVVPLLASLGLDCEISGASFPEAIAAVRAGRADGFFLASQNSERDGVAVLFAPIVYNNWYWYFLAETKLDPSDPGFSRMTMVGTVVGSNQAAWLSLHDFHMHTVPTADPLPGMLLEHKGINSILGPELVINAAIAKAGLVPDKFKTVLMERKPFGLYLSRAWVAKNPELVAKLRAAVTALNP